ncbi:hypothetical protein EYC98_18255 [Halieaceae bacterium IMCC14734]|uniref:Elp3/MiaA/NifB-like radical SAM core domain-containing protein n=1 Tax=Candidatus Litorirhabdus singularis TaxID=2518993 RepID=A0ABT3TKH0_9GAMM|nr:hypothetical protein [Candidatus Litorirhabdus singularis]MCX2982809.1 hypothetical protein [Candidatus Litorirhabdus singularis]
MGQLERHLNSIKSTHKTPNKRVLIVNCYFPEMRESIKRSNEVPDTAAPVLLAGFFNPETCDVVLYNEVNSGFIEIYQPALLQWPDIIVLTGLTAAFDRLLHVTAYAKSYNSSVIVAAGGHAVRSLPQYARQFFDYLCLGDVEEIEGVIAESMGQQYVAEVFTPRYDLAYWMRQLGYVESSRNCNFRCDFCSLTATGLPYSAQPVDYLERQLDALGKRFAVVFNDNQLVGDGNKTFDQRIAPVKARIDAGQFQHWFGFVTDTFFWDDTNIQKARQNGCISLFVGVESFADQVWLDKVNKSQNAKRNQVDLITRCLDEGILFKYGLVFDPTERTTAQMYQEMDIICDTPEVPIPLFTFTATPYPGTPMFKQRLENKQILPNTNMRDLESSTLCVEPMQPIDEVVDFIKTGKNFRNYRSKVYRHQIEFMRRYRHSLDWKQKIYANLNVAAILFPRAFSSPLSFSKKARPRTHISTTERLDDIYTPCLPVAAEYRHYFEPTVLVDAGREINPLLQADVLDRVTQSQPLEVLASSSA